MTNLITAIGIIVTAVLAYVVANSAVIMMVSKMASR